MNVLMPASGSAANGSGGAAGAAQSIVFNGATATSATVVALGTADLVNYAAGTLVSPWIVDYAGQTGFVGSGVYAAYVKSVVSVASDPDYIRRVSFNVARVQQVTTQALDSCTAITRRCACPGYESAAS